MQVHRSIERLPSFKNAVVTIGTFDGVHKGHRKIIDAVKEQAAAVSGESVIITFQPHPRKVVHPQQPLQLINTLKEKTELLQIHGIDHVVIVPFTPAFADQTAEQYVEQFLVRNFDPHTIIIGYDHRFGKGRSGDYTLLEALAPRWNYQLIEIPRHVLEEIAISSTKIRKALLECDIETANKLLGYSFFFEGTVVEGDKLGRQLGYPTANLEYTDPEKIRLGHGVYAVEVVVDGTLYKGMLSIGDRPTLQHSAEKTEVNLFDFDQDLYGKNLRVIVKKFLRSQEKYPSLQELQKQLDRDKSETLKALRER